MRKAQHLAQHIELLIFNHLIHLYPRRLAWSTWHVQSARHELCGVAVWSAKSWDLCEWLERIETHGPRSTLFFTWIGIWVRKGLVGPTAVSWRLWSWWANLTRIASFLFRVRCVRGAFDLCNWWFASSFWAGQRDANTSNTIRWMSWCHPPCNSESGEQSQESWL